ncbi:MAG: ABC-type cobalamin/Fe3+-siderophore transport system, ATPase component [Clostridiales bacterium]|jgi:iron complex transport system ATP-binding protein|nr:ABC-type cobalamin/Fe3+-siderophore transport system, ATPase component [Clostridiales bacterium]
MLRIENAAMGYNGIDVVKNISLEVKSGENLCIIGPNGCGKTTLLKAIGGLLDYSGNIKLDNKEIKHFKRNEIAKKLAILSQISSIYFSYTVYETVMLGRYLQMKSGMFNTPSKIDVEMVEECLERVGLQDVKERQITSLSGGQLQRVFLARTFAQEPDIILLDEPTNHLDLKHQIELVEYLKEWSQKENKSAIGVFHDINLAIQLADNALILKEGNVVKYGDVSTSITGEVLESVYGMDVKGFMVNSFEIWNKLK